MTDSPKGSQDKLLDFVTDPKNIAKAAEGSMDKRLKVMAPTQSEGTLRKQLSDILLGRAITDPKMIEKFRIAELTQQEAISNLLQLIRTTFEACLPPKYTLQTGLLWDSQDATDGFHEAIAATRAAFEREVGRD